MFNIVEIDENGGLRDKEEISILARVRKWNHFSSGYKMPSLALRAHLTPGWLT